jgi:acyl-CoA synthetase (AMP-forming)/AMP-acid ligase II
METPLTPLEFARRSRQLYPEREAVVDGDLRLSYEQFFDRCDAWSVEVEGALLRHPAVQEVAIVGMPDERWGEAPHAFVVLKAGATATETELRNYARDHLAHFKCPQKIHFVRELPKTATGKVQKYVLRGKPAISKQ